MVKARRPRAEIYLGYSLVLVTDREQMSEPNLPEMTPIGNKRDFRTITKNGNDLVKTIIATKESPDHGQIIKEGLESTIKEYISIIVEKTDLNELVSEGGKYQFLQKLDIRSIFEPKKSEKDAAGDKLQFVVDQIANDQKSILKKLGTIDQLEKVSTLVLTKIV